MNNATAVLRARSALSDAGAAAHDTATLVPQLVAEAQALAADTAAGRARLPPAARWSASSRARSACSST